MFAHRRDELIHRTVRERRKLKHAEAQVGSIVYEIVTEIGIAYSKQARKGTIVPAKANNRRKYGLRFAASFDCLCNRGKHVRLSPTTDSHSRRRRLRHQTAVHEFQFTKCWAVALQARRFGMDAELCGCALLADAPTSAVRVAFFFRSYQVRWVG